MKKVVSIVLALLFTALLCSCGQSSDTDADETPGATLSGDQNTGAAVMQPVVDRIQEAIDQRDWSLVSDYIQPGSSREKLTAAEFTGQIGEAFRYSIPVLADALNGVAGITLSDVSENVSGDTCTVTYSVSKTGAAPYEETISLTKVDGKWYIKVSDADSRVPVTEAFLTADLSSAETFQRGNYVGLCTAERQELIEPYFEEIGGFTDQYCMVKRNNKWGILNREGILIADYIFDDVQYRPYQNDWWVKYNEKWGAINFADQKCIGNQYDEFLSGSETKGYVSLRSGSKCGMIAPDGTVLIPFEYDDIGSASTDAGIKKEIVPVKKGEYWGLVDESNQKVVDFIYSDIAPSFVNSVIGVGINGSYGAIDRKGNYVVRINTEYKNYALQDLCIVMYTNSDEEYNAHYKLFDYTGKPLLSDYDIVSLPVKMKNGDYFVENFLSSRGEFNNIKFIVIQTDYNCLDLTEIVFNDLKKNFPQEFETATQTYWSEFNIRPNASKDYYEVFFLSDGFSNATQRYNCLTPDGELLIPGWTTHRNTFTTIDHYILYDDEVSEDTFNYYLIDQQTHEAKKIGTKIDGIYYHSEHNDIFWKYDNGICTLITANDSLSYNEPYYLVDTAKAKIYTLSEYVNVDYQLSYDLIASDAIVVTDGVLFGLLGQNGLAGIGIAYTDYSFDKETGEFRMIYGADKQDTFRILPNGAWLQIN